MSIRASFLQRIPGATRGYRKLLPLLPLAAETLSAGADCDLVLSFSHAVAKNVRVPEGVPHVCYCFTPMRYAWETREQYFAGSLTSDDGALTARVRGSLAAARNAALDLLAVWDRRTSARVTEFVACSQTIARRIERCYGRTSRVIYPPVDTDFYTPNGAAREGFYLCVSALVPYKRTELAIAAANRLGRRLVIIGRGPERARLEAQAGPTIEFLGWQSNEVIRERMRRCRALLFPGEEDFGIVPVEAQACGAPVIAYGVGGATETVMAPDGAAPGSGMFFDEQSSDALAEAMLRLEQAPEYCCAELARASAERFCGPRYEREMLAVVDEFACRRKAAG
jgi:glycosyltransferase involved in cell wall biosynthesis